MQNFVAKLQAVISGQPVADPADMWLGDDDLAQQANTTRKPSITQLQNIVMPEAFQSQVKFILDLSRGLDLTRLLTPTNYHVRREHWLQGDTSHSPVFVYDTEALEAVVKEIDDGSKFMWHEYHVKDKPRQLLIDLAEDRARNTEATGELISALLAKEPHWANQIMAEKYGELTNDLVLEARAIADSLIRQHEHGPTPPKDAYLSVAEQEALLQMSFDTEAIKFWLEWSIGEYGWEIPVMIAQAGSAITVHYHPASGVSVVVPEGKVVNGVDLLMLNRHNIECHIRDVMNSDALVHPFGMKHGLGRVDGANILAEGHAILEEAKFFQKFFGQELYPMPWSVLAMEVVQNHQFCFNEAGNFVAKSLEAAGVSNPAQRIADSWKYTYRIFCGNHHTGPDPTSEERFIFLKDKAYLEGYLIAKKLDKARLSHWLNLGGFSQEELIDIAKVVTFNPQDLPYPDKDTTHAMSALFLADAT